MMCATPTLAGIQFEELTDISGVHYTGSSWGASWGNFNGDKWPDLWVGNHSTQPDLFVNNGDGTFSPTTLSLSNPNADMHGAAWADFDNDGDQDLYIEVGAQSGTGVGPNQLLVNTGISLDEQATDFGLDYPEGRGRTPLWFDWNGDGYLDVVAANDKRADGKAPTALFSQINGGFVNSFSVTGLLTTSSNSYAQLITLHNQSRQSLLIHGKEFPDAIYDTTQEPFVNLNAANTLLPEKLRNVRDSAIADFNGDLYSDIFTARSIYASGITQSDSNEVLARLVAIGDEKGFSFSSMGAIQVRVASPASQASSAHISIGASGLSSSRLTLTLSPYDPAVVGIAPHTAGVDTGVYIGFDSDSNEWRVLVSGSSRFEASISIVGAESVSDLTAIGFSNADGALTDNLLIQDAGGFVDTAIAAGLGTPTQCDSTTAADFDNDMDVDIYLVCQYALTNIPNILYENLGGGSFNAVANAAGAEGSALGHGDAVAAADYDNDGFVDLFVTNSAGRAGIFGPSQFFHNMGNDNHWIEIDLEGNASSRDGIGARVLLTAGGTTQLRERNGGMHNKAQDHQRLHFGLGNNTLIEKIEIEWPSGIKQVLRDLASDQIITITEKGIDNSAPTISGAPPALQYQNGAYEFTALFSDADGDTPLFSISNKPAWANFDPATGQLSGVPGNDDVGLTTGIVISVDDQQEQPNSVAKLPPFNIEVLDVNDTPTRTNSIAQQNSEPSPDVV